MIIRQTLLGPGIAFLIFAVLSDIEKLKAGLSGSRRPLDPIG
mgnify:CR=1 FL=1